jgi:magnesium-transporting ATPase (P-type)
VEHHHDHQHSAKEAVARYRNSGRPEESAADRGSLKSYGLTDEQASERLAEFGANRLETKRRAGPWLLLLCQFKSPIILILIGAAILSLFLQDTTDALIILAIVIASGLLDVP